MLNKQTIWIYMFFCFNNILILQEILTPNKPKKYFDYLVPSIVGSVILGSPIGLSSLKLRSIILGEKKVRFQLDDIWFYINMHFASGSSIGACLASENRMKSFWTSLLFHGVIITGSEIALHNNPQIRQSSKHRYHLLNYYPYYFLTVPFTSAAIGYYVDQKHQTRNPSQTGLIPSFYLTKQSVYVNLAWQF